MELWGITGLMGSGKSMARRYLESLEFPAVDADAVARILLSLEHPENLDKLKEIFGPTVVSDKFVVDRPLIRLKISNNEILRKKFEAWLHPEIRKYNEVLEDAWRKSGAKVGFIEGTRLVESGALSRLTGLIFVDCPEAIRRERLHLRGEMNPEEQDRLARTQDENLMRQNADVIWDNSGDTHAFSKQIDQFLETRKLI
jgi:dephospho-CoA kinase